MAFLRDKFSDFFNELKAFRRLHSEARAIAENFILEERLSESREDGYEPFTVPIQDFGAWHDQHQNYIAEKIELHHETPETFTPLNASNLLPEMDPDQCLVRIENLSELSKLARGDDNVRQLIDFLERFIRDNSDEDAVAFVEGFLNDCNMARDWRPIFAGFWGDVKDVLSDDDWANKIRDRFGLGHLDPEGDPIPVLLMRYRVSDVIDQHGDIQQSFAAIPTVLDSEFSPFFCPTPESTGHMGQTLDLSPGGENDYEFNCEVLHQYIDYRPAHICRFGLITEPPGKPCEEARRIHLQYLETDYRHFARLS